MAQSPAHQLGQIIGNLLEDAVRPLLQDFCHQRGFYLDVKGARPGVRNGSKVTWSDRYGNSHDLDFVIEKDGTPRQRGRPLAFIETAWRRYTKHSRNKAQEIQGAILPIAEEYQWDKPFLGAILAGFFTASAIEQLQSCGFSVLYFHYSSVVLAFHDFGIDICFDEATTDGEFSDCVRQIGALDDAQHSRLKKSLLAINRDAVAAFAHDLEQALARVVERLIIVPLHGREQVFSSCAQAARFIREFDPVPQAHPFIKYEIMVKFSNGDHIGASFQDKPEVEKFLKYLSTS